jgi:hypothetical protein
MGLIFNVFYVLRCACMELQYVASIHSLAGICVCNFVSLFNTFLLLCVPVAPELVCSTYLFVFTYKYMLDFGILY